MTNASALKDIYLFKSLTENELKKIEEVVSEKTFMAGQDIFITGQEAQSFFVIRMGTVKIYTSAKNGDDMDITILGSGSHFGEMPIVDQGKRSATAQATETSTLLEIDYANLRTVLDKNEGMAHKFYRELARYLAGRLRATTQNLSQVKELKLKHF